MIRPEEYEHTESVMPVPNVPRGMHLVPVRYVKDLAVIFVASVILLAQIILQFLDLNPHPAMITAGLVLFGVVPMMDHAERRRIEATNNHNQRSHG